MPISDTDSAQGGTGDASQSAQRGVVPSYNVTVDHLIVKGTDRNDNDTAPDLSAPNGPVAADLEVLALWGTAALSDADNLEWHRRCLLQYGVDNYVWAVEATQKAKTRGTVSNPGAYFTSLLRKRPASALSAPPTAHIPPKAGINHISQPDEAKPAAEASAPVQDNAAPAAPSSPTGLSEGDCARLWQTALIHLRVGLPIEDYTRILRYAVLLELDTVSGWALFGLPTDYMRDQVTGRLAGPISVALSQVCGTSLHVAAAVLPGQGRLAADRPTLGALLGAAKELAQTELSPE